MSQFDFIGLFAVWFISLAFILLLTYREFRGSASVLISFLHALSADLLFGFPFTFALVFQFDVQVVPPSALLQALLASVSFYAIYYVAYKTRLRRPDAVYSGTPLFSMNKTETRSLAAAGGDCRRDCRYFLYGKRAAAV